LKPKSPPGRVAALPPEGGLAGALERGRIAREAWTQDGTLLSAPDYAGRRGASPKVLSELEAHGELFSLNVAGVRWYPAELLKLSADEAAVLCRELTGDPAERQLIFLMRAHGALDGQTATSAIAGGQLARVLQLAHAWQRDP
jgi:hypothetical protein